MPSSVPAGHTTHRRRSGRRTNIIYIADTKHLKLFRPTLFSTAIVFLWRGAIVVKRIARWRIPIVHLLLNKEAYTHTERVTGQARYHSTVQRRRLYLEIIFCVCVRRENRERGEQYPFIWFPSGRRRLYRGRAALFVSTSARWLIATFLHHWFLAKAFYFFRIDYWDECRLSCEQLLRSYLSL